MSEFSATDAAFEGFRVARERPWAIVAWAGVALAMSIGDIVLRFNLIDPTTVAQAKQVAAGGANVQGAMQLVTAEAPIRYLAAAVPIQLLFYGILFAAAFRVVLEPKSSVNGLRLGIQELRQVLLMLISGGLIFVADLGLLFVTGLAFILLKPISEPLAAVVAAASVILSFALVVVVPIRLSLAGPLTFVERNLRPFSSWVMTRGHFWPMLGAYVLASVFAALVVLLGLAVMAGLFAIGGKTIQSMIAAPDHMIDYLSPFRITYLIGSAFISAQAWAIIACPAAKIFRDINREAVP